MEIALMSHNLQRAKELGSWVHNIRLIKEEKKENTLTERNINQLNKINFNWSFEKKKQSNTQQTI